MFALGDKVKSKNKHNPYIYRIVKIEVEIDATWLITHIVNPPKELQNSITVLNPTVFTVDEVVSYVPCCTIADKPCAFRLELEKKLFEAAQKWADANIDAIHGRISQYAAFQAWQELKSLEEELWKHVGEM